MRSNLAFPVQKLIKRLEKYRLSLPGIPVTFALLGIAGGEAAIFYDKAEYALWIYLLILLLCTLGPLRFKRDASMLQALALLPVFRIMNLGMPFFHDRPLYWLMLVYGPLIPASYLVATSQSIELPLGGKRALLALPFLIPLSAAFGVLEYSLVEPAPFIGEWTLNNLLLIGIIMFSFVALVEELLFRGIIQRIFENQLGRTSGLIIASTLFGLMYASYGGTLELIYGLFLGILLGLVYDYTKSLVTIIAMHGTLNFFLFAVIPYHPWIVSDLTSIIIS